MFCTECGTQTSNTAKFCFKCGAALVAPAEAPTTANYEAVSTPVAPEPEQPAIRTVPLPRTEEPARAADPASFDSWPMPRPDAETSISYEEDEPKQWWQNPLVWVGFAGLVFAFLAYGTRDFWLGTSKTGVGNTISATSGGPAPVATAAATGTTYYAVRKLKLRDKASTIGSQVKGEVQRGATLSGTIVMGEDEKSQWLKIDGTGYFASLANLSDAAPPPLKLIINKTITLDENTVIKNGPTDSALPIDNAPSGTAVEAVGVTNEGWIEIARKQSGVGYFKPSAASANVGLIEGKPVVAAAESVNFDAMFQFNADNCDYGPQMTSIYSAISSNANGAPFSIDGAKGQYKSTRSGGDVDSAEAIVSAPIVGKLKNLGVTGLFVGYEGQGIYFADSVDAVGQALSSFGFVKQGDGSYATDSGGVGGYVTKSNGKTTLYCGA